MSVREFPEDLMRRVLGVEGAMHSVLGGNRAAILHASHGSCSSTLIDLDVLCGGRLEKYEEMKAEALLAAFPEKVEPEECLVYVRRCIPESNVQIPTPYEEGHIAFGFDEEDDMVLECMTARCDSLFLSVVLRAPGIYFYAVHASGDDCIAQPGMIVDGELVFGAPEEVPKDLKGEGLYKPS